MRILTLALAASIMFAGCAASPPAPVDPALMCDPDCATAGAAEPRPAPAADCEPTSATDRDGDGKADDCDDDLQDGPTGDADRDGVPNEDDACPGHDDTVDKDSDGKIDGCDDDPEDGPTGDADGDTIPNEDDVCPGEDDRVDANGDGTSDCQVSEMGIANTCWRVEQGPEGKYRVVVGVWDPTQPAGSKCQVAETHTPWTWRTGVKLW